VHVFDMTSPSKGATKTITPSTPPRIPQP